MDSEAIWLEPDPASVSGQTVRVIGHSALAGFVVVVILFPEEDSWIGVNAWKANKTDQRRYWKDQP